MDNLQSLLEQRAEIERKIAEAQRTQRADAIAKVRSLMAEHGLTTADLNGRTRAAPAASGPRAGGKVPPKYRNAATGETWSGRGLQPKWLRAAIGGGARIEDFAI